MYEFIVCLTFLVFDVFETINKKTLASYSVLTLGECKPIAI